MSNPGKTLSLRGMLGEGLAGLGRYPGLWLSLYLVQLAAAGVGALFTARILAAEFGAEPVFDRAVDGDFTALVFVLAQGGVALAAVLAVGVGVVLGYALLSWYLVGGANAVLLSRPGARHEVAHCFGSGGATTFFAYARLALVSLIPHAATAAAFAVGVTVGGRDLRYAVTVGDVAGELALPLVPAALLFWLTATAVDYARIELSRRAAAAETLSAWRALLGAYRAVLTDRRPLVHVLLYAGFFIAVSALYVAGTHGQAMAGAAGAVAIFAVRQLVLAARFGGKVVCAAGQVALAGSRRDRSRA